MTLQGSLLALGILLLAVSAGSQHAPPMLIPLVSYGGNNRLHGFLGAVTLARRLGVSLAVPCWHASDTAADDVLDARHLSECSGVPLIFPAEAPRQGTPQARIRLQYFLNDAFPTSRQLQALQARTRQCFGWEVLPIESRHDLHPLWFRMVGRDAEGAAKFRRSLSPDVLTAFIASPWMSGTFGEVVPSPAAYTALTRRDSWAKDMLATWRCHRPAPTVAALAEDFVSGVFGKERFLALHIRLGDQCNPEGRQHRRLHECYWPSSWNGTRSLFDNSLERAVWEAVESEARRHNCSRIFLAAEPKIQRLALEFLRPPHINMLREVPGLASHFYSLVDQAIAMRSHVFVYTAEQDRDGLRRRGMLVPPGTSSWDSAVMLTRLGQGITSDTTLEALLARHAM
eukprot:m.32566 g.32566  ORF g.32566 m.32566 type:complete len:399 (+) comp5550_c0_seq1:53-1249(+)